MSKTIFFTRPNHDDVLSYLFYYSKKLIKSAKLKGFNIINKEKKAANKEIVTNIIIKKNPSFIMFNGHGNPSVICGHDNKVIIDKDTNYDLLKDKIVYAFACSSAAELGVKVGDENSTFIGYSDDFALGMDGNSQAVIQRDKRAKLFLEPSNLLVESLLKGNSAKEAVEKAKKQMKENISKLKTDPFPDAKDYIPYLFNNYLILEVLGNKNAKINATI